MVEAVQLICTVSEQFQQNRDYCFHVFYRSWLIFLFV